MSLPGHRVTYADYLLLPEDKRYEVIEGELLVTPAPNTRHQRISTRLVLQLAHFVMAARLGEVLHAPTDVILSDENVVQPDLLFVTQDRLNIMDPAGGVRGAPDLVVEILSPSTASRDKLRKRQLYAQFGVKEYWIVDPGAQSIEVLVYSPAGMDTWRQFTAGSALTSPTLDGLVIHIDSVFEA